MKPLLKIQQIIHEKVIEKKSPETIEITATSKVPIEREVLEDLEIGKPLSFASNENHSFNQWLQLSIKKPIVRNKGQEIKNTSNKESLIDQFIENKPKIAPLEKGKIYTTIVDENRQDVALMTETLAKVYLEQKKYENAMQAYKILSLKYPEKSGFFADQIKSIQILQKNKL